MATSLDEVEALQTDVMRFLAIICMCLMIVFSLVQSMPVGSQNNKPLLNSSTLLEYEIKNLKKNAGQLISRIEILEKQVVIHQNKLKQLITANSEKEKDIKKLSDDKQKKEKQAKEKSRILTEVQTRLEKASNETIQTRARLRDAEKALQEKSYRLEEINDRVRKNQAALEKAKKDVAEADLKLSAYRKNPGEVKEKPANLPAESADKAIRKKTEILITKSKKEKIGFSLRFASDSALEHLLIKDRRVKLYLLAGARYWILKAGISRMRFLPSPSPGSIYEMDFQTVPDKIKRAGKTVVAAFGSGQMTYGVTLSPDISGKLARLMAGQKGGDIIIEKNGELSLE